MMTNRQKASLRRRIIFFSMLLELRKEWFRDTRSEYIRNFVVPLDAYFEQFSGTLMMRVAVRAEQARKLRQVMEIAGW